MMPVVNSLTTYTTPPTLVGAALPGNNTLRVNADNVPPPVSNVGISNNTKGGNAAVPVAASTQTSTSAATSFMLSPFIYTTPTSLSAGAQTTFFTQLMGQDGGSATGNMLAEYEAMLAMSQVKYKPSNANLPEPEPASIFGRILVEQQQAKGVQQTLNHAIQQTTAADNAVNSLASLVLPRAASAPTKSESAERPAPAAKASAQTSTTPRSAIHAYLAVVARNDTPARKNQDEPIEAA
jgi:hypothetical protein